MERMFSISFQMSSAGLGCNNNLTAPDEDRVMEGSDAAAEAVLPSMTQSFSVCKKFMPHYCCVIDQ